MKQARRIEAFTWLLRRLFRALVLTKLCFFVLTSGVCVAVNGNGAGDDIFQSTNLMEISIEINAEGLQLLRESGSTRFGQGKPQARARIVEAGRTYTNVAVQLKGFTSFQPIDQFPALTLNFNKHAPKQKFHGLTKISLNNSVQDPTRLHEKLSRELFAAAGVPVPRADHALVKLNGRPLGLYVLVEGYDKSFLKHHFGRADGTLYEGGVLQDIDRPLRVDPGSDPAGRRAVQRLIEASREPDEGKRFNALAAALDMDRFLSMTAMEALLCHSDSYSMNRNNYRMYHDPGSDKMVFMPHGMDRVLGTHRSRLDLPFVPPALSLVSRGVLSTTEGRRRFVERAGILYTNVFVSDRLCRRARELDLKISQAKQRWPLDDGINDGPRLARGNGAGDLCRRIAIRSDELRAQFEQAADFLPTTPTPDFDSAGVARIGGWKIRRKPGQTDLKCEPDAENGGTGLRLRSANSALAASVRTRVSLPAGDYRLSGQLRIEGGGGSGTITLLRYNHSRFDEQRERASGKQIDLRFRVSTRANEEVEFICELRGESSEVSFDPSSLRLTREP